MSDSGHRNEEIALQRERIIMNAAKNFVDFVGDRKFTTILADPPWQFTNRTGKMAPEHRRLARYSTMALRDICEIPVAAAAARG